MGVGTKVVDWLNDHGHEAVHLREQGLERLPNGKIFEKAVVEKRIVINVRSGLWRNRRFYERRESERDCIPPAQHAGGTCD
jgi:hypothetical protein